MGGWLPYILFSVLNYLSTQHVTINRYPLSIEVQDIILNNYKVGRMQYKIVCPNAGMVSTFLNFSISAVTSH